MDSYNLQDLRQNFLYSLKDDVISVYIKKKKNDPSKTTRTMHREISKTTASNCIEILKLFDAPHTPNPTQ